LSCDTVIEKKQNKKNDCKNEKKHNTIVFVFCIFCIFAQYFYKNEKKAISKMQKAEK
jgi:hypothetical protein